MLRLRLCDALHLSCVPNCVILRVCVGGTAAGPLARIPDGTGEYMDETSLVHLAATHLPIIFFDYFLLESIPILSTL